MDIDVLRFFPFIRSARSLSAHRLIRFWFAGNVSFRAISLFHPVAVVRYFSLNFARRRCISWFVLRIEILGNSSMLVFLKSAVNSTSGHDGGYPRRIKRSLNSRESFHQGFVDARLFRVSSTSDLPTRIPVARLSGDQELCQRNMYSNEYDDGSLMNSYIKWSAR